MSITRPLGFRAAATTAGLKPSGKPDLALIVCDADRARAASRSAGAVFTQNAVVGAPVEIGRAWRAAQQSAGPSLRAILVNAGCSNAATGQPGIDDARETMRAVARAINCEEREVLPSSTGIIGHRLPVARIVAAIPTLAKSLSRGEETDESAAAAIMTTDLVPKSAHREVELAGHTVHIGAICKGSGMIAPRLDAFAGSGGAAASGGGGAASAGLTVGAHATLLSFITTDAAIAAPCLQAALESACRESFDRVSIDAHPSCSDTVAIMASGLASQKPITRADPAYHAFKRSLTSLCQELAQKVARDGEGATRTFRVEVRGARTGAEAERLARAVVDSPLVKCAIHGKDPNWGRIVTAAGNAGIPFDTAETTLAIGGVTVYHAGVPTGIAKDDRKVIAAMSADPVECLLTVGSGPGHGWMLGCDLSADYVRINADYTT